METQVKVEYSTYTQVEKGFICEDDYVIVPASQAISTKVELENLGHMHISIKHI